MTITSESSRRGMGEINVTPMIDILLVLLIIFMVIVPQTPSGLAAAVPQQAKKSASSPDHVIVVQVLARAGESPTYLINGVKVAYQDLLPRLTAIYANRAQRVMFVKGDESIGFQYIASVIDIGRAANVDRVALITPGTQLAQ